MTCIVGLVDGPRVLIGGDSAGASGWDMRIRRDPKVFTRGRWSFGYTTSFRMGQLLQYKVELPHVPDDLTDVHAFMVAEFIDALRAGLKTGGYAKTVNGVDEGGRFLVGLAGHLFTVHSDYQVAEYAMPYAAVGCGEDYALGSLHTSRGRPRGRLFMALDAAATLSNGVARPFTIVAVR